MASNLTDQVRNIAEAPRRSRTATSKKITVDAQGDPRAEEHRQHDGRPAQRLRGRGHARVQGGRHRRQAGRPGGGRGRLRHVAQPHRAGNFMASNLTDQVRNDRPGHEAVANGDLSKKIIVDAKGEILEEEHDQHDGRPAQLVRGGGHARRARSAPRAASAARPRWPASPAPGAGSLSRSTRWPPTSPTRCGTSRRSRRR